MFVPSTASIAVEREEPEDIDVTKAQAIVERRNRLIAYKVVTQDMLKKPKRAGATARRRIAKKWEVEKRLELVKPFVEEWNKWREFYLGVEPGWEPKTEGQMTCIENILEMVEENDLDLGVFIACQFRNLLWRKVSPGLPQIQSTGLDAYFNCKEDVLGDIDENAYYRSAEL